MIIVSLDLKVPNNVNDNYSPTYSILTANSLQWPPFYNIYFFSG